MDGNDGQEDKKLRRSSQGGELEDISPHLPTSRTNKAEDWARDMEQRTFMRRTGTTSENFVCKSSDCGGDNDANEIKNDDGQCKKLIPETWRNNTL